MFSSGPSSRKNNMAGIGSGVLVPTRFVWPHGGKIVYLTGSFTGWSQLISMTPLEGCPTAFQAIWSLTPGYHQYKFVVDGEYRHDEHQPSIAATNPNIGIVNTVILTSGLNAYPPDLSSDTSRVNMEVDSEISPMSTSSGLSLPQGDLRISEADIGIFRHRISEFLSNYTAYQMMPYSGKEFILDVDLPVKQAFHILYEKGIHMAPLWDSHRGMFVGILSPFDFILILREIELHCYLSWSLKINSFVKGKILGDNFLLYFVFLRGFKMKKIKNEPRKFCMKGGHALIQWAGANNCGNGQQFIDWIREWHCSSTTSNTFT